jgi:hypothetical protein
LAASSNQERNLISLSLRSVSIRSEQSQQQARLAKLRDRCFRWPERLTQSTQFSNPRFPRAKPPRTSVYLIPKALGRITAIISRSSRAAAGERIHKKQSLYFFDVVAIIDTVLLDFLVGLHLAAIRPRTSPLPCRQRHHTKTLCLFRPRPTQEPTRYSTAFRHGQQQDNHLGRRSRTIR